MFLDGKRCFSLISVVHYSYSVVHFPYYDNTVANTIFLHSFQVLGYDFTIYMPPSRRLVA